MKIVLKDMAAPSIDALWVFWESFAASESARERVRERLGENGRTEPPSRLMRPAVAPVHTERNDRPGVRHVHRATGFTRGP